MKKLYSLILIACLCVLAACGQETSKEESKADESNKKVEAETTKEKAEKEEPQEEKAQSEEKKASSDEPFNDKVQQEDIGERSVVFTKENLDLKHSFDGLNLNVEAIQTSIVKLDEERKEFHENQDEIGVISIKTSVENTSDKEIQYYPGSEKFMGEDGLGVIASMKYPGFIISEAMKPGEKAEGYYIFVVTKEAVEDWKSGTLTVPTPFSNNEPVGKEFVTPIPLNGESDSQSTSSSNEKTSSDQVFADGIIEDNLGKKEVLYTKTGLDTKQKTGDVEVTVKGIQTAKLTVNDVYKENFEQDNLNVVTLDLEATNTGKESVQFDLRSASLDVNGSTAYLPESQLSDTSLSDEVKPNEKINGYLVFLVDPHDYKNFKEMKYTVRGPQSLDFKERLGDKISLDIPFEQ
ncbi:DUF4352 domain-containing protein [Priestia endophytica]|uniref:DUF4352 domain-containing protein n=1 Tax=Priestia endophytica DSM 13796 TaxID=1121089 RepID=A0A1I6C797_9BACI|nr:DUF4352 domain-containing protein [Priestia endophytica]KYG33500.1 hypothetical protein AZF06_21900 [Priestia endophytica]SFQ89048.1 protein of unknown function [Priestia endophytica DSM 13796]